ncbi:unnamed protein product [Nezara viridula]|uniref:Uncharacterized protein n=1 Tax=Nezara viridula TaxID=85310 RepID=A0A9P0MVQ4_NEZVI|nr:unnamed protein product [Nezara viridula]
MRAWKTRAQTIAILFIRSFTTLLCYMDIRIEPRASGMEDPDGDNLRDGGYDPIRIALKPKSVNYIRAGS